jgi:hypothetical protein
MISRSRRRDMSANDQDTFIETFVANYQKMDPAKQNEVMEYLTTMLKKTRDEAALQGKSKTATATFSYPPRGHPNDGNPALMAILDILPQKKLTIEENEYTRQRAIWLCEDFTVEWAAEKAEPILSVALSKLRAI